MNGYLSTAVVTDSLQRIMSRCRAGILSHFLHRVGFTVTSCHQHVCRLLPCISTLTTEVAVYFCCTFLEVASTGRYPALLLCGARTFLVSFPTQPFGCLLRRKCTTFFVFCQRMKAQGRLLCPEPTFFAVCSRFVLVQKQTFQRLAWRLAPLFKIFIVQYNSFTAYFEKTFPKCRSVVASFSKKIFRRCRQPLSIFFTQSVF